MFIYFFLICYFLLYILILCFYYISLNKKIQQNRLFFRIFVTCFFCLDPNGCYYNYQHYEEGDRIVTNEPCLNCTCHNRMLMCYLRVCPFSKAIGQDCTVQKSPDQCCPVISCPEGMLLNIKTQLYPFVHQ